MNTTTSTATEVPVTTSSTWRILKHDTMGAGVVEDIWRDLGEHTLTHEHGWRPYLTADWIGEQWGAGDYMYFETGEGAYSRVEFMTVVADTVYREQRDEEA